MNLQGRLKGVSSEMKQDGKFKHDNLILHNVAGINEKQIWKVVFAAFLHRDQFGTHDYLACIKLRTRSRKGENNHSSEQWEHVRVSF